MADTKLRWRYCGEPDDGCNADWDLIQYNEHDERVRMLAFIAWHPDNLGWYVWVIGGKGHEPNAGPITDIDEAKAVALALGRMEDGDG